jgi:hypothetical protein
VRVCRSSSDTTLEAQQWQECASPQVRTAKKPSQPRFRGGEPSGRDRPKLKIEIPPRPESFGMPIQSPLDADTGTPGETSTMKMPPPSATTLTDRFIDGVGRLLKTPETIARSARRAIRAAPISPFGSGFLSPSVETRTSIWLELALNHDVDTMVRMTGRLQKICMFDREAEGEKRDRHRSRGLISSISSIDFIDLDSRALISFLSELRGCIQSGAYQNIEIG